MQKKVPQIMQKIFRRTLRQKSFFSVKLPGNFIKLTPTHVYSRRKLASKKERAESIGDNVKIVIETVMKKLRVRVKLRVLF